MATRDPAPRGAGAGSDGGSTAGPQRARPLGRLRRGIAGTVGVLLVIGASTIGLHDWADSQLETTAVHASLTGGGSADG